MTVGADGCSVNDDVGVVCVCIGPELTGPLPCFGDNGVVNGALHCRQLDRSSGFGVPHFRQYIVSPQTRKLSDSLPGTEGSYHFINTAPHVTPAPKADIITTSPGFKRFA